MTLIMSPWSHMRRPQRPIQAKGSFTGPNETHTLVAMSFPSLSGSAAYSNYSLLIRGLA